jgi:type IV secretory pathway TraG/TraD family ATPase VirD4
MESNDAHNIAHYVDLLRRRTSQSSVVFGTNVKYFEDFYDRWYAMKNFGGLYLGRTESGDARSGHQHSTLVLGPTRSGKTSSVIIPNLLTTTGPAVITSTKDDVVRQLAGVRRDGATLLFDPSGTVPTPKGVFRVGYSPIRQARDWDGAVLVARGLLDVARRQSVHRGDDHWSERAGALVAPLLHAAALSDESLGQLAARVDARRYEDYAQLLEDRYGEFHPAVSLLHGVLATEDRERSSIWSSAAGLFAGVRTEAARHAAREAPLDVENFLAGPHQLHVVSPSRHQAVATPLVVGIIEELVHATYDRSSAGTTLLLALDELANVAPLPRLASIVSEGAGQGVLTLACLQDLSQARARWGATADGFLSLFPTTLILPGIADRETLLQLQRFAGRHLVETTSAQRDAKGRLRGHATSLLERDVLSIAELTQGRPGHALGLDERNRVRWIELTPAHRDVRFRGHLESPSRERSRER